MARTPRWHHHHHHPPPLEPPISSYRRTTTKPFSMSTARSTIWHYRSIQPSTPKIPPVTLPWWLRVGRSIDPLHTWPRRRRSRMLRAERLSNWVWWGLRGGRREEEEVGEGTGALWARVSPQELHMMLRVSLSGLLFAPESFLPFSHAYVHSYHFHVRMPVIPCYGSVAR